MTIAKINTNQNHWMPKEISTASIGTMIAATSNVAFQILTTIDIVLPTCLNNVRRFAGYSFAATSIVGTVLALHSMVRLCQKTISEKNKLEKNVAITALGVFSAALAETMAEFLLEIAPSFRYSFGHSMAYSITTNLALQTSLIIGLGGIVFTAYAAYRTGRAIFLANNPEKNHCN